MGLGVCFLAGVGRGSPAIPSWGLWLLPGGWGSKERFPWRWGPHQHSVPNVRKNHNHLKQDSSLVPGSGLPLRFPLPVPPLLGGGGLQIRASCPPFPDSTPGVRPTAASGLPASELSV